MKRLSHSVNIIPVIAKADTMTIEERQEFKQRVGINVIPLKLSSLISRVSISVLVLVFSKSVLFPVL